MYLFYHHICRSKQIFCLSESNYCSGINTRSNQVNPEPPCGHAGHDNIVMLFVYWNSTQSSYGMFSLQSP